MRVLIVVGLLLTAGCTGGSMSEGDDVVGDDAVDPDASITEAPDAAPPGPDATPPSFACGPTATAGHQKFDCPEGVTADVEISQACLAGGCGLIVDVHGLSMNADAQNAHTRMRTLGPARGYVVIQPTAPGTIPSWGTGEHDDVVWELAEATIYALDIDPDRVHFTGFSQGGMMSFRQLCAHADRLASIAPHAGGGCFAGQEPSHQRAILFVHGYRDVVVTWSGVAVPQREAILAAWDFGAPQTIADGTKYLGQRWVNASGTVFEMYEHDYSTGDFILDGHCLPGPHDQGIFRCDNAEFDSATIVLDFFDAHPRGDVD